MFTDLLSPVVVFVSRNGSGSNCRARRMMMCMKGRKIDSELYQDVDLYEFVVSYVNTCYFCFSENALRSRDFIFANPREESLFIHSTFLRVAVAERCLPS